MFCFLTLLIIGGSFYYQFFINNKSIVQSKDFEELIDYVMDEENFQLLDLSYNNYGIDLDLELSTGDTTCTVKKS